ncbi:MAG: hypothetical protein MK137_01165 [Rickettsiales bacterium]|nr:hypothetical protein [Rickettsiales bacterium]
MSDNQKPRIWIGKDNQPIDCNDKIQLLNDNLDKVKKSCDEMIEDAIIMGCDEEYVKCILLKTVASLDKPFSSYKSNA